VPIFRNRSGVPYAKDTQGDDFRAVRAIVFNSPTFRRSGTVEALTGHVEPGTPCPRTWSTPSPNQFGCTGPMRLFSLPACARSTRPGGLQEPFFANKAGQKRIGSPDLNYQNEDQKKAKPKPLK